MALRLLPLSVLMLLKRMHYPRAVRTFSEDDESDLRVVKCLIKPGDHVVDVGANVGWYTKVLSDLVGKLGCVYSIEPIPVTFELLSCCVEKLKLSNVRLLNCGVSQHDGMTTMEVPKFGSGGDNFYQARIAGSHQENWNEALRHYVVSLKSLDTLFADTSTRITFIKCDVEGHELSVVKGAAELAAKFKPAWLIEASGDPDSSSSEDFELFRILQEEGYSVWLFDGKYLRTRCTGDKAVNYFFLTKDHIDLVKGLLPETVSASRGL